MNLFAFLLISFIVGFVADIALNDISKTSKAYSSLLPYYKDKSIMVACGISGVTIVVATGVLMVLYKMMTNAYLPRNFYEVLTFLALGYLVGYVIDVAIDKSNILGETIQPFYKSYGSGNSGALAFEITLVISLLVTKYVLPYCC